MQIRNSLISPTARIFPNVEFGCNVTIEDYCIIGCPFKGYSDEKTIIGDNAVIRAGTIIYAGNNIGKDFHAGNKANIRELNNIGNNVSVGTLSVVEHHVTIKDAVRIHTQVFIPEYSVLEAECWIGPNAVITNVRYPKHPDAKKNLKSAHIHNNAKIGANVTLLPGVVVGRNSLIGAGSVVTKDVGDNSIVAGNPAKIIGEVDY